MWMGLCAITPQWEMIWIRQIKGLYEVVKSLAGLSRDSMFLSKMLRDCSVGRLKRVFAPRTNKGRLRSVVVEAKR
jgi:hypothetical protein